MMEKQNMTTKAPLLALAATATLALAACGSSTTAETTSTNESSVASTTAAAPQTTEAEQAATEQETQASEAQQQTETTTDNAATAEGTVEQASAETDTQVTEAPATEVAAGASIENPCEGVCTEVATLNVNHPTLGPVQIVTYQGEDVNPGSAPSSKLVSYALIQDGVTLGWAQSHDGTITLDSRPSLVEVLKLGTFLKALTLTNTATFT